MFWRKLPAAYLNCQVQHGRAGGGDSCDELWCFRPFSLLEAVSGANPLRSYVQGHSERQAPSTPRLGAGMIVLFSLWDCCGLSGTNQPARRIVFSQGGERHKAQCKHKHTTKNVRSVRKEQFLLVTWSFLLGVAEIHVAIVSSKIEGDLVSFDNHVISGWKCADMVPNLLRCCGPQPPLLEISVSCMCI